jgi:hypothetical protein
MPLAMLIALWLSIDSRAQAPTPPAPAASAQTQSPAQASPKTIVGAWSLNKDLSDNPSAGRDGSSNNDGSSGSNRSGSGSGSGGGYGGGRGGRRGGGRNGYGNPGTQQTDPEQAQRMRDALRDLTTPSDHLTITKTDTLVVVTSADGRTTRLSPDGKKIKDDNTKIERKTKFDGDKLVVEINGLGQGKATQTYAVNDSRQLIITLALEGSKNQTRTITHVYDFDAR